MSIIITNQLLHPLPCICSLALLIIQTAFFAMKLCSLSPPIDLRIRKTRAFSSGSSLGSFLPHWCFSPSPERRRCRRLSLRGGLSLQSTANDAYRLAAISIETIHFTTPASNAANCTNDNTLITLGEMLRVIEGGTQTAGLSVMDLTMSQQENRLHMAFSSTSPLVTLLSQSHIQKQQQHRLQHRILCTRVGLSFFFQATI